MQFEEFDNKVREAADHHHPAYDENAWARMEKLLNKHLPQENDNRRRIIFFLFLFLLLGGAAVWLFSSKPWSGSRQETTAKTTIQKPAGKLSTPLSSNRENPNGDNNTLNKEETTGIPAPDNSKTITNQFPPDQIAALVNPVDKKDRQRNFIITTSAGNKKTKAAQPVLNIKNNPDLAGRNNIKDRVDMGHVDAVPTNTTVTTLVPGQNNNKRDVVSDKIPTITIDTKPVVNDPLAKENTNKDNTSLVQSSPAKKTKDKNKKRNTFFFTLSAGPDISATGGDPLGKARLLVGGGLGYTFKDRLTIRSGFYSGRKIYTSSPGSYHPPATFWSYYPNLQKVDANCQVYEIPLSLSYNFSHSAKQQLFASAGVSSLLMKSETYDYYYKYTATGPTVNRKYTIRDQNKHYFSILTLSGGYQKNIGKSLSVTVEPYLKLPLSGIGFGNVKLNSGGILLSVGIKPFTGSGNHRNNHH
ncbi:MAG TPA: hypothetical protein VIV35_12110 [Chitinophagaceae bacterium]